MVGYKASADGNAEAECHVKRYQCDQEAAKSWIPKQYSCVEERGLRFYAAPWNIQLMYCIYNMILVLFGDDLEPIGKI